MNKQEVCGTRKEIAKMIYHCDRLLQLIERNQKVLGGKDKTKEPNNHKKT